MRKTATTAVLLLIGILAQSQEIFKGVYPIGDPANIGYKTSMVPEKEKILFEANPILRMALYNNIQRHLQNAQKRGSSLYLNFRPQLRMYDDNSLPVKTPTYRIGLGYQQVRRRDNDDLFTYSVETGHFSNGQSKCAFDDGVDDGSHECTEICNSITDDSDLTNLLNRQSGNFSTNYTDVFFNYRFVLKMDDNYKLRSDLSLKFGYTLFHDNLLFCFPIGGYTDTDIEIYGRHRWHSGIQYTNAIGDNTLLGRLSFDRFSTSSNFEVITTPHKSVAPLRVELIATTYLKNDIGFFVSGIFGHDNYNYRFVDSGSQVFVGITFDIFPPLEIK